MHQRSKNYKITSMKSYSLNTFQKYIKTPQSPNLKVLILLTFNENIDQYSIAIAL
jgi:hypothetical protein